MLLLAHWPWADQFLAALARLRAIPPGARGRSRASHIRTHRGSARPAAVPMFVPVISHPSRGSLARPIWPSSTASRAASAPQRGSTTRSPEIGGFGPNRSRPRLAEEGHRVAHCEEWRRPCRYRQEYRSRSAVLTAPGNKVVPMTSLASGVGTARNSAERSGTGATRNSSRVPDLENLGRCRDNPEVLCDIPDRFRLRCLGNSPAAVLN